MTVECLAMWLWDILVNIDRERDLIEWMFRQSDNVL